MIRETLKLLFIENCTIAEAAGKLGVEQTGVKDRLLMLQHMGYIEEVCNNSAPKSASCCLCSAAGNCSAGSNGNRIKAYQLTKKGEKICRN